MRRLHTAMGAGALLLALSACAQQPSEDVGFGGQPPAPEGPVQPEPEQQRSPVAGDAVDTSALPKGYPSDVWTQEGGSVIVATGQEGGCGHVRAEVVEQNESRVRLALIEETPEPPKMCTMDLRYPPVAARLDAPLDQRQVVLEQRDVKVPA